MIHIHSSIGTSAIERVTRPICYRDILAMFFSDALKDNNLGSILRPVTGK
ncbi:hypothetical protein PAUR_b0657 [Pseudoalteromonas aurantia 208]|uniref:Uncharacterized protein n=1 Tax=Pseudoalteromonas aurantia 208 TaxID=1314867 RepID=A0ABR9EI05_9GAMM|nr:hypothetical protein [Pseudoalteromonas aurantia 208]